MSRGRHVEAFLEAVDLSWRLASAPEVATAWSTESACSGMTVGGLTHHLLNQAGNTVRGLRADPTDLEPIGLLDHYARAAWVTAALDDDVNVGIRDDDNARADAGPEKVLARARGLIDDLPDLLDSPRDPDTIFIPWQGWGLTTEDFLTTRMMEMVVHSDDLAASVGLATPVFPDGAITPVLALLTAIASRRHGQAGVVRALARPQRAPESVAAF